MRYRDRLGRFQSRELHEAARKLAMESGQQTERPRRREVHQWRRGTPLSLRHVHKREKHRRAQLVDLARGYLPVPDSVDFGWEGDTVTIYTWRFDLELDAIHLADQLERLYGKNSIVRVRVGNGENWAGSKYGDVNNARFFLQTWTQKYRPAERKKFRDEEDALWAEVTLMQPDSVPKYERLDEVWSKLKARRARKERGPRK